MSHPQRVDAAPSSKPDVPRPERPDSHPGEPCAVHPRFTRSSSDQPGLIDVRLVTGLPALYARVAALENENERLHGALAVLREGDPDQLLTTTAAAELLGRSEPAIRQAARRGKVPAVRIGRLLRFKRSDLLKLAR